VERVVDASPENALGGVVGATFRDVPLAAALPYAAQGRFPTQLTFRRAAVR
jgi:hypothetical protein